MIHKTILTILSLFILTGAGFAQTIGFQSYILDDDEPLADGQYNITFRIYDQAEGGAAIWQETQEVTVSGGVVSADLGAVEAINTLPFNKTYWVSVQLPGRDEMGRLKLSHSPYAMNASSTQASYYYFATTGEVTLEPEERNENLVSVTVSPPPVSVLEDDDFSGVGMLCNAVLDVEGYDFFNVGAMLAFFSVFDADDQEITRGFACGKNPYLGMYLVDPERDPGPYRVQFGIENPHQSTTLEINGINVWVQWGALFTP